MSETLRLDLSELEGLYKDLLNVSSSFSDIESVGQNLRDAVGHDGLGERVGQFGSGWDDRRKKIITSLDTIWHAVKAVETTFTDVDGKLANALTPKSGA